MFVVAALIRELRVLDDLVASDADKVHSGGTGLRIELLDPHLDYSVRLDLVRLGGAVYPVLRNCVVQPVVPFHILVLLWVVLLEPVPRLHVEDEAGAPVLQIRGLRVAHEVLVHDVADERAAEPVVFQRVVASLEHAPAVLQEVLHTLDVFALPVAGVELLFDDLGEHLGRYHRRFTSGVREDDRFGQLVGEVGLDVLDTARNHRRAHPGLAVVTDNLGVVLAPVRALVDGHVVVEPLPLVAVVRHAVLFKEPVDGVDELDVAGVAGFVLAANARINLLHPAEGDDGFGFVFLFRHHFASLRIKKASLVILTGEGCQWVNGYQPFLFDLFALRW